MKAIHVSSSGQLEWKSTPDPVASKFEVVLDIAAAGINRADLLQRAGKYPPPAGAPEFLGLECSGTVVEVGEGVPGISVGDKLCALLSGGGYAEKVAVDYRLTLPVPENISLTDAGGLPEAACTVWSNLIGMGALQQGETLLVHGGASGIGSFAIQAAKAMGVRVVVTVGSEEKAALCTMLGADLTINYKEEVFETRVAEFTDGVGADVILDVRGGDYIERNVNTLARKGRLLIIGTQGGREGTLPIGALLRRAATVAAASLRNRPLDERISVVEGVRRDFWPLISEGRVRPLIDSTFDMVDAASAHERMQSGEHAGKVLLTKAATE